MVIVKHDVISMHTFDWKEIQKKKFVAYCANHTAFSIQMNSNLNRYEPEDKFIALYGNNYLSFDFDDLSLV